jgi:nicotinate-nucleotide adenylyltransferase
MKTVGIYSGVFDPIHDGHIAFAEKALQLGKVDEVYFLLEAAPRRKRNVTPVQHRQAMLELALADKPKLDTLVLEQAQFSVVDTLPWLQSHFPDTQLCLLMGSDLFAFVETWPNYPLLRDAVSFGVAIREGGRVDRQKVSTNDWVIDSPLPAVSSSQIRSETSKQTPAGVLRYINTNKLY